jgi:hypothetical protein
MADIKYHPSSLYRNTLIIDDKYLDIYESNISHDDSHTLLEIEIENKYNMRPDLMAYDRYGDAKLWWVFAEFNQDLLQDPIIDFKAGLTIQVPDRFI